MLQQDIETLQKANQKIDKDINKISVSVKYCLKEYSESFFKDYEKSLVDADELNDSYYSLVENYKETLNTSITILSNYIENNMSNIDWHNRNENLLEAVEALVESYVSEYGSDIYILEKICEMLFQYVREAPNEDIFDQVIAILNIEKIDKFKKDEKGNFDKQMWIKEFLKDIRFFPELLNSAYGKNYEALRDIYLKLIDVEKANLVKIDKNIHCSLMGKCSKFIPSGRFYFIAYPFKHDKIKDKIIEGFTKKFKLEGVKPLKEKVTENVITTGTVLCKICEDLLSSKFGIFVLNKYTLERGVPYLPAFLDSHKSYRPNHNVTLELGLAMGSKKKFIMLVERGIVERFSDLQGYFRIEYDTVDDIPSKIIRHNLSALYNEEN